MSNKEMNNMAMVSCTSRSNNKRRVESVYYDSYVPSEVWSEILLRVPIIYLLVCRSVCKLWRSMCDHICKNCAPLPLCGFITVSRSEPHLLGYLDALEIENGNGNGNVSLGDRKVVTKAECDTTLLAGLRFHTFDLSTVKKSSNSILSHKGLLLLRHRGHTYKVHNPVTGEVYNVPPEPMVESHGQVLINLSGYPGSRCRFIILKFQPSSLEYIIMYYSETQRWSIVPIQVVSKVGCPSISRKDLILHSYNANYLAHKQSAMVLLATHKGYGVTLRLYHLNDPPQITLSSFPFPKQSNDTLRCRLWFCQRNLFLSYYYLSGVSIWYMDDYNDCTWVLLLEITSDLPESSKSVLGMENLWTIIKGGEAVAPINGHPDMPVIYFLSESGTFGYDYTNDDVFQINYYDNEPSIASVHEMFPFIPCLCSFDAADVNVNTHKTAGIIHDREPLDED